MTTSSSELEGTGPSPSLSPGSSPRLELSDISVRFGGIVALDGVAFDVMPDEVLGIIGPNGAGKTTLFDVITGVRSAVERSGDARGCRRDLDVGHRSGPSGDAAHVPAGPDLRLVDRWRTTCWPRSSGTAVGAASWPTRCRWPGRRRRGSAAPGRVGRGARAVWAHVGAKGDGGVVADRHRPDVGDGPGHGRRAELLLLDEPASGLDETEDRTAGEPIQTVATDSGAR